MIGATIEPLQAEQDRLTRELAEVRERACDLALDLEALKKSCEEPEAIAKEMARLHGTIRTLEATRDSYKTKCDVLTNMKAALERKLAKMGHAQ